jgi:hypothetical protein
MILIAWRRDTEVASDLLSSSKLFGSISTLQVAIAAD